MRDHKISLSLSLSFVIHASHRKSISSPHMHDSEPWMPVIYIKQANSFLEFPTKSE